MSFESVLGDTLKAAANVLQDPSFSNQGSTSASPSPSAATAQAAPHPSTAGGSHLILWGAIAVGVWYFFLRK